MENNHLPNAAEFLDNNPIKWGPVEGKTRHNAVEVLNKFAEEAILAELKHLLQQTDNGVATGGQPFRVLVRQRLQHLIESKEIKYGTESNT